MRLGRILKITMAVAAAVLVVAAVALVVVLRSIDFNEYKPLIAEEVRRATGRELVIAGDLGVAISLSPAIVVERVTLSNAAWGSRPAMVKVERLEARIALMPLLFGAVEIRRLVLEGADILIEVDKRGRANFEMQPAAQRLAVEAPATPPIEARPPDDEGFALPVVNRVVIRDSRVRYTNAQTGVRYQAKIETLSLEGEGPDEPTDLRYEGEHNDTPIRLRGTFGPVAELARPSRPWPMELTAEGGGATLAVGGTIAAPLKAAGLDLKIAVDGNRLRDLSPLAGAELPAFGAYSLSAAVKGDAMRELTVSGLEAALGKSDLSGDATVTLSGDRPLIRGALRSKTLDLTTPDGTAGQAPAAAKPVPGAKSARVFPDDPLPLAGLRAVDARLDLVAGTLIASGVRLERVKLGVSLSGGDLAIRPLQAGLAGGRLTGSVRLDGRTRDALLAVKTDLTGMDFGRVLKQAGVSDGVEGPASLEIDISGRGGSVRAIMAGLNGKASFVMGEGRFRSGELQTFIGGPRQILGDILRLGRRDYTTVNCGIAVFDIADGLATSNALLLDTDIAAFVGGGKINLRDETLNLVIQPKVKQATLSLAVPVHVKGTLADPEYSLDRKGVAKRLVGIVGVFAYPPAALVGLGELGAGAENPCIRKAGTGDAAAQSKSTESKPPGAAKGVIEGVGEGITKGLKGLLGE